MGIQYHPSEAPSPHSRDTIGKCEMIQTRNPQDTRTPSLWSTEKMGQKVGAGEKTPGLLESQVLHGTKHPGPWEKHRLPTWSIPLPHRCSYHSYKSTGLRVTWSGSQKPPPQSSDDQHQHHGAGYWGDSQRVTENPTTYLLPPREQYTSAHRHCQPHYNIDRGRETGTEDEKEAQNR